MLHQEIEVKLSDQKGFGLFAVGYIFSGEVVWNQTEVQEYFTREELDQLAPEKARLAYWDSSEGAFAIGVDDLSNYMNHSCEPNLGWKDDHTLVALRTIVPGEEVSYDYATSDVTGINGQSEMVCLCGSLKCRGIIRPDDLLRYPELQQRYAGFLPPSVELWLAQQEEKNE